MSEPKKKSKFWSEFRTFIARGNVMDMAVGVIIGAAFKAIIDSLVADILNPLLGLFSGGSTDLSGIAIALPGGGSLMIGNFLNSILNFLIMALVIFLLVRTINKAYEKIEQLTKTKAQKATEAEAAAAAAAAEAQPKAPTEAELLTQILAELRAQRGA